jgi:hypothetical protein
MSGFFKPTQEQIKAAGQKGLSWANGTEVQFQVTEVDTKEVEGSEMLIINTEVLNTEHKGKSHKHFVRDNDAGWGIWMSMLQTKFEAAEIAAGLQPSSLIGQKMMSKAQVKATKDREYCNFYNFAAVDGAPNLGGQEASASDIPF